MRRRFGLVVLVALATLSCAKSTEQRTKTLTQRERDSILATENLPGASVVGRAMKASDAEAARAAKMDSLP